MELNQVTISGHVVEPGMYSLGTFKDLKSLIIDAAKGFYLMFIWKELM